MEQYNLETKAKAAALPVTASSCAVFTGPPLTSKKYSQQQISQLWAGTKEFESVQDATEFVRLLDLMHYLQDQVRPRVPIAWNDPLRVKDVLIRTALEYQEQQDPAIAQVWVIQLNRLNYLKNVVQGKYAVETRDLSDAACFEQKEIADAVIDGLKKIGVACQLDLQTAGRRRSTIAKSVEEIGL